MRKLTQLILFGLALSIGAGVPAFFAAAKPSDPDPAANPVLAQYIKSGTKVFYLGKKADLDGWFLIKDNQVQIGYTSADKQNIVFGVMLDKDGQSISALQIKNLYDSNPEVNKLLASFGNQPPDQPANAAIGAAAAMPPTPAISPSAGLPPGERLLQALQEAAGVDIGAASAPKLSMVVDPNCPHCQTAWKELRNAVFGGKLQIRLVPIGEVDPDSARAAAQLLGAANPLEAWDKYIAGDHSQLAGTPDAVRLDSVRNNHLLIDAWHIQMTPYMVYRAKDGQVKIVQGEPQQPAAIVNDIAP